MNDDDVIERLRGIEREVPLSPRAQAHVLDRMLDAYRVEQPAAADQREVDHLADLGDGAGVSIADRHASGARRTVVMARAALILFVAAGMIGLVLATRGGTEAPPAVSDGALPPVGTTIPPAAAPESDALREVLGFRPFSTYDYVDEQVNGDIVSSYPMTIRVGELADTGMASVRRLVVGATGDDRIAVDVAPSGVGAVVVPAEFVDPTSFGGACTGGGISLSRTAAGAVSAATCGGVEDVELDVSSTLGATERLDLDTGVAVDAVPLSITIQPADASSARTVTLWFSGDGVVRWSFPTPGGTADYDISPESADRLG